MFIFYNADTLAIHHVVEFHPPTYGEYLAGKSDVGPYIEHPEVIPFIELYLTKNGSGEVTASRRAPAPDIVPPTSLKVNVEATFTGVPAGTNVNVNSATLGVMDSTGILEFTPLAAGFYRFLFEKDGVMP